MVRLSHGEDEPFCVYLSERTAFAGMRGFPDGPDRGHDAYVRLHQDAVRQHFYEDHSSCFAFSSGA